MGIFTYWTCVYKLTVSGGNEVTANDGNGIFADFRKNQTLKADEIIAFQRMEKKMSFAFKGHNSLEKGGTLGE